MSVPPTMSTSSPFIRWKRATTSAGMNVETAWPRCRGPDAYGQATQTRIFAIRGAKRGGSLKAFAAVSVPTSAMEISETRLEPDSQSPPVLANMRCSKTAMYGCPLGAHATVAQRAEYVGV